MKYVYLFICLMGLSLSVEAKIVSANAPEIEYVGRTLVSDDGSVSFDWSGTYFHCRFTGGYLAMRVSDTKKNYYNLFIDGQLQKEVITTHGKDSLIVLAKGLSRREHVITLQKRTEGEQGLTTIHSFEFMGELRQAGLRKARYIEFIGDSITAGFGTEGKDPKEPFSPETENCNLAYGAILSRMFDTDYTFLAHSGRGLVRNYADTAKVSKLGTMSDRVLCVFDERITPKWDYSSVRRPDVVVINLGSNDFSTRPHPSKEDYILGYENLVKHLRLVYGDIPIICVSPRAGQEVFDYTREFVANSADSKLYFAAFMQNYCNDSSDLGAVGHPNNRGNMKIAMLIAPYLSTATGWDIPL